MRSKNVRNKRYSKHIKSKNKKLLIKTNMAQSKIEGWEKNLSFTENINNLGINNIGVNQKISKEVQQKMNEPQKIEAEEIGIDAFKRLTQSALDPEKAKNRVKLSLDEEWAVQDLYKKYQTNYVCWELDHKLNQFQWTRVQCKKKYEGYIKRYGTCPKINKSVHV